VNIQKDIRLALAALLVLFSVGHLISGIVGLVGYDSQVDGIVHPLVSAVSLLAAAVGLIVAYHLYRRSQATEEGESDPDGDEYDEENGCGERP
jgi:uncharacterized membrane-anchored protein